jgi:SAM-dependent methyltransferase
MAGHAVSVWTKGQHVPNTEDADEAVDLDVWETLFDWVYASADDEHAGWQDSFLGTALPAEHMREWREATVASVRALGGRRVIEIGCGTGMVLSGVAATCEAYLATDLSSEALSFVADRHPELRGRLQVHHLPAHEAVRLVDEQRVDVVVLNSVVQYFPHEDYLRDVLDEALGRLRPGGQVFVGDVRDLRLQPLFDEALRLRGSRGTAVRSEVLASPPLFSRLEGAEEGRYSTQVLLKRGQHWNEMNAFRYDVVLTRRDQVPADTSVEQIVLHWGADVVDLDDLVRLATLAGPPGLAVRDIPNARLSPHALGTGTLPDTADCVAGLDPEACWRAVEASASHVVLSPSADRAGAFDVLVGAAAQDRRLSEALDGPLTRRL